MDLAEFQLVRAPRAAQPGDNIELSPEIIIPPKRVTGAMTHLPKPTEERRLTLGDMPPEIYGDDNNPLQTPRPSNDLTIFQRVYAIVNLFDSWLRSFNDRVPAGIPAEDHPPGEAAAVRLEALLQTYNMSEDEWSLGSRLVMLGYHAALKALLTREPKTDQLLETAVLLTRRVLIAGLLSRSLSALKTMSEDQIYDLIHRLTVSLADVDQAAAAPTAKVELIREAKVADLHVVRREWACYLPSEVANIRNLMANESIKFTFKNTRERETTTVSEEERREAVEQEDQSRLQSELSQEVSSQLAVSINGYFDASAEYRTPVITARISAGIDAGLSLERSERHASKIAREAVSRAISRVDTLTRESRTIRELTRTEDTNEYSLSNGAENLHAIYRWVDRVDRYQVFRYPLRYQLEFQLPEPAEFYRWRTDRQKKSINGAKQPPAWTVKKEDITPEGLIALASTYRASSLPAPVDAEVTIARTVTVELSPEHLPKDQNTTHWNLPTASKETEIPIPTEYAAVSVTYSGHGFPVLGRWLVSMPNNRSAQIDGFHSAFASIGIGGSTGVNWVGGYRWNGANPPGLEYLSHYNDVRDIGSAMQIQVAPSNTPTAENTFSVPYGRAMLVIGTDGNSDLQPDPSTAITFDPGAVGTIRAAVSTTGLASCVVTFEVKCAQTAQSYAQWQLDVYDALFAAWSQWNDEWEAAQNRQALVAMTGADAGGTQRNEQIIREELKRQVIAWLLAEAPFSGRPGLRAANVDAAGNKLDFQETDFAAAIRDAPTIQFLEQAFEWTNMTYMFYPYYWAGRPNWETLSQIQANDPEFERFLRAGSARVIVPARPGFDDAVQNWLLYQIPFVSGQLPSIGDPLYVSIDREIRDITNPWEGGIAEDFWESRMSTTMLYLETQNELPISNDNGQLPAEKGKPFEPRLICS